jgi:hypothetical protein
MDDEGTGRGLEESVSIKRQPPVSASPYDGVSFPPAPALAPQEEQEEEQLHNVDGFEALSAEMPPLPPSDDEQHHLKKRRHVDDENGDVTMEDGSDNGKSLFVKQKRAADREMEPPSSFSRLTFDEVFASGEGEEDKEEPENGGGGKRGGGKRRIKGEGKRGKKVSTTCGKILEGIFIDVRNCIRTADMEDCLPLPATFKECRDLCFTRQGRSRIFKPARVILRALRNALGSKALWRSTVPLSLGGLLVALFCEGSLHTPRYNTATILVLLGAVEFPDFPRKSVRPQVTLALIAGLTFTLDFFYIVANPLLASPGTKALIVASSVAKGATLYTYLKQARNTMRARKYLVRRVRLFGVPLAEPRRIMRDVRGRFMALALLQLAVCLAFVSYFVAALTNFGYSELFVSSRSSGVSLPTFLIIKSITSGAIFVGLALDCDVVLTLAHFGCLGWCMGFVKSYTRKKRIEVGGWPYPFFYNETRHGLLLYAKGVDVLWGLVGWVTVGSTFGYQLSYMETELKILLTLVVITLVLSDVWVPLLLAGISWLLRRRESLQEAEVLSDSDDSELDELEIRDPKTLVFQSQPNQRPVLSKRERRRRHKRVREAREESNLAGPLGLVVAKKERRKGEQRRRDDGAGTGLASSDSSDSSSDSNSNSSSDSDTSNEDIEANSSHVLNPLKAKAASSQFASRRSSGARGARTRRLDQEASAGGNYFHDEGVLEAYSGAAPLSPGGLIVSYAEVFGAWRSASTRQQIDAFPGPVVIVPRQVSPEDFSGLWDALPASVQFTAAVEPVAGGPGESVNAESLAQHLSRLGFFVVASQEIEAEGKELGEEERRSNNEDGTSFRVFAFVAGGSAGQGSAATQTQTPLPKGFCLFEFALTAPRDSRRDERKRGEEKRDKDERERWSLQCLARCSHEARVSEFVALLLLGDLYDLL